MGLSWALSGPSWGPPGPLLGLSWAILEAMDEKRGRFEFRPPLGARQIASWAPLGALLGRFWALLGPSWASLGPLLGLSWGRLGGLLGRLGALLSASRAVLGRSWGPLGRLGASDTQKDENANIFQTLEEIIDFASSGPLRGPFGAVLGHLEGLLSCLEAVFGVLERSCAVSRAFWTVFAAS